MFRDVKGLAIEAKTIYKAREKCGKEGKNTEKKNYLYFLRCRSHLYFGIIILDQKK